MTDTNDLQQTSDTAGRLATTLGDLNGLSRSFGNSLNGALRGAVVQGRSLDQVLRGVVTQLSSNALTEALRPLTSSLSGGLTSALSNAFGGGATGFRNGGVLGEGRIVPFADGGVVATPRYFPMSDGRTGLMGEAGAEAIMPLTRGSDGRLGVSAQGQRATNVTVNISTPDVEGFRRSEAQVQASLARAVGRGRRGL